MQEQKLNTYVKSKTKESIILNMACCHILPSSDSIFFKHLISKNIFDPSIFSELK